MGLMKCGECGASITAEQQNAEENLNKLNLELEGLEKKLNILLDSYLDQVIDAEIYRKKKNEIFDRKLQFFN